MPTLLDRIVRQGNKYRAKGPDGRMLEGIYTTKERAFGAAKAADKKYLEERNRIKREQFDHKQ